jgi:hypothetical protein
MISLLPALVACTPDTDSPNPGQEDPERTGTPLPETATTSRCPTSGPPCIDLMTVPVSWRTEPGWDFNNIYDLGDVNGDGVSDLSVGLYNQERDVAHSSILFGPFLREATLPADEDLGFPDTYVSSSDLTGDGQLDILFYGSVITGPVSSATTLADSLGTVAGGEELDIDSDGDLDYVKFSPYQLDIWTGSWTTWGVEPPTLSLSLPCSEDRDPDLAQLVLVPDLDLDGVAEMWVAGNMPQSDYNNCQWYRLPADLTGVIDVPQSHVPATLYPPWPFGDQNGDGLTDFRYQYTGPTGRVSEVLSPPMTEMASGWAGTLLGVLPEATEGAQPYPTSVVGDPHPDLRDAVQTEYPHFPLVHFIEGGDAWGAPPTATTPWSGRSATTTPGATTT